MTIPARAHFCWIGARLPWVYVFAVLSAGERSELGEIILHHTDVLEEDPAIDALRQAPHVRLRRLDPHATLIAAGEAVHVGEALAAIYARVASPAIRSDLLRAAILYLEGGIYLDVDTITTASLRPLLEAGQFLGHEFIVWPHFVRASRSPRLWARSLSLDLMRKAIRRMPDGWEKFRRVERFYYRSINGAVMGAEAGSRLVAAYLEAMAAMAPERQVQANALGPDLLQEVVDRYPGSDLVLQAPPVFYPIPPEVSEQWFRIRTPVRLDAVLAPETRVAHWYASVRTKACIARIDPAYVRAHRSDQLYSALVCDHIRALPGG